MVTITPQSWTSDALAIIMESQTTITEVLFMLSIPELAMPRTRKVTTVCNGRREVWTDYEEAKAYFLELMISTDGEERQCRLQPSD